MFDGRVKDLLEDALVAFFIPEDKITEIRNRADIIDIVSESVLLKKAGRNFVGLCPFHSEKAPSFTVSSEKQMFYCFGCGEGGNAFRFLMKNEGLSFPEAVKRLARRYGIEIPTERLSAAKKQQLSERERLLSINRAAMEFFCNNLLKESFGKKAQEYLNRRGFSREIIQQFNLGYAPGGWDRLSNYFSSRRIPFALVEKAGLIIPRRSGSGYYDRFRERIIFPIFDLGLQVIGFGGRVMDESLPKYLNSPESPVYSKSRSLYGLHRGKQKCRETETAYIVEGYLDLIKLHQFGIENSVATLGTSLTEDHIRLLKGFAGRAILVFDSDDAGLKAAHRTVGIFMKEEMEARVMVLPKGQDPDSFLSEFGYQAFMDHSDKAMGMIQFLTETAVEKYGLSVEGKIRILKDMQAPLASIQDGVARSLYTKALAERIGVDETAVLEKVRSAAVQEFMQRKRQPGQAENSSSGKRENSIVEGRGHRMERHIIAMMLQFPDILPEVERKGILDRLVNDSLQAIGRMVLHHSGRPVSEIIDSIQDEKLHTLAVGLAMKDNVWDYDGCLKLLQQFERSRNRQKDHLMDEIKSAENDKDQALVLELLRKKQMQLTQDQ